MYMSEDDQNAMLGEKIREGRATRERLVFLVQRASTLADHCDQNAWELRQLAGEVPGERKPGMVLTERQFLTPDELDRLKKEINAEQSRLAKIQAFLAAHGVTLKTV